MFSDDVISKAEGGDGDNAGGHQRASLASLAEITVEGHFLKAVSTLTLFVLTFPFIFFTPLSHFDPKRCTVNRVSDYWVWPASLDPLVTYWICQIESLKDEQAARSAWWLYSCFTSSCPWSHDSWKLPRYACVLKEMRLACMAAGVWLNMSETSNTTFDDRDDQTGPQASS